MPCLSDNYGFLLHHKALGLTAAVDTPDAVELTKALHARGWGLTHIFNTHHHADHCGGNMDLKAAFPRCTVIGPAHERADIPGMDSAVAGGDGFVWGDLRVEVMDVGGHTHGHIAFYIPDEGLAFVGDSLFALGCGRLFEGTPKQAWESLSRLMALPDETLVYCAHEYTAANAKFAATIELKADGNVGANPGGNPALVARLAAIDAARARSEPTVPTTIGLERATNPFVRPAEVRLALGLPKGTPDHDVFAEVRRRKDSF